MTEADGVGLFLEFLNVSIQIVLAYISILTAFLVMSYFAAGKLDHWLMFIVLALFTVVCFLLVAQLTLVRSDMGQLLRHLLAQKAAGVYDIAWLGNNPAWAVKILTYLHILVALGGYIGCLVFFFQQRRSKT